MTSLLLSAAMAVALLPGISDIENVKADAGGTLCFNIGSSSFTKKVVGGNFEDTNDENYTIKWDCDDKTLTLRNFEYEGSANSFSDALIELIDYTNSSGETIKLVLEGSNHIKSNKGAALRISINNAKTDAEFDAASNSKIQISGSSLVVERTDIPDIEDNWSAPAFMADAETIEVASGVSIEAKNTNSANTEKRVDYDFCHTEYKKIANLGSLVGRSNTKDAGCIDDWVYGNVPKKSDVQGAKAKELYQAPENDGNTYLGKAYYYTDEMIYPNATWDKINTQNKATKTDEEIDSKEWTRRGAFDENGKPIGSHIFYQYYYVNDNTGNVQTDDISCPIQYLVYDENPENTDTGEGVVNDRLDWGVNSCSYTDIKGNGTEILCVNEYASVKTREFNGNFYAMWGSAGNITVNGSILYDAAIGPEYYAPNIDADRRYYAYLKNGDGINEGYVFLIPDGELDAADINAIKTRFGANSVEIYADKDALRSKREYTGIDAVEKNQIEATVKSSNLTINGDVAYLSLADTYTGNVIINGMVGGVSDYLYTKATTPEEVWKENSELNIWHGATARPGKIVEDGSLLSSISWGEFGGDHSVYGVVGTAYNDSFIDLNGYTTSEYDGKNWTVGDLDQRDNSERGEVVEVGVSGFASGISPIIREKIKDDNKNPMYTGKDYKKKSKWDKAIRSVMGMGNTAKLTIFDIAITQNNSRLVEPSGASVELSINGLKSWINGSQPVTLYHVRDDGVIEAVQSIPGEEFEGSFDTSTTSFSTYFIAEGDKVPSSEDIAGSELADLAEAQKNADKAVTIDLSPSSGSNSSGGGSSNVTSKTENIKNADGSTTVKTTSTNTKTGQVTVTETTKKADGSKEVVKTVTNKDGSGSITETETAKDGSRESTETKIEAGGKVSEISATSTSADEKKTTTTNYGVNSKNSSKLTISAIATNEKTVKISGTIVAGGTKNWVTKKAANVLKGNQTVTKVIIGKGITSIGKKAFSGDKKLKSITVSGSIKSIGNNAFKGIAKKAVIKVDTGSKSTYKKIKKLINKSGIASTVKVKMK